MRRKAGIGAIHKKNLEAEKYKDKTNELQESQFEQMSKQMEILKTNLEEFANKHKNEIKKNSQFRKQFQEMCAAIGVDPLSSGKGFWSVLGMGDFYFELSVQVVETCLAANHSTGGIMELKELRDRLVAARGRKAQHQEITEEDILIASKKLKVFGNSFNVHQVSKNRYLVQSIPGELSLQETSVLGIAANQEQGMVTADILIKELGWTEERSKRALDKLVSEKLAWIDAEDDSYWFPSLFPGRREQDVY